MIKCILSILKYFKENNYKKLFISFIVIVLVASFGAAFDLYIVFVEKMVYSLFDTETYTFMSVIALCMRLVVFALTVIILCLIGDILIFQIINKYFFETINKLLLKIHNSDYEKVKDYDSDDLSGRIFIESRESLSTFIKGLHLIIYNVLLLVFAIIFLAGIQLLLAMIILFANIIIIACLQIFDRKLQKLIKLYVSTRALNRSKLQLVFKNIELIKLTGKYDDEDIEYSNKIDILFKYFTDLRVIEIFLDKILPAITDICRAVSLYFLSMKVLSGNIQLSDLIFFMLLINRINYPFLGFIWSRTGIIESKEIFDRQGEIFHLPEKTENYSVCENNDNVLLWFKNGCYSFSADSEEEKRDVSIDNRFVIKKGDIICVTGENGTGKTTLLSIILGLKKLDKGSIFTNKEFIDNKKDYLPRPPAIFACSVNWNALFSDDDCGKYNDVIRKYDFSEVFEKNYKDDYVYDKISGGEKSKTVFIRSEIIDAPFIIFDEPEAWLDSGQKRLLVERIKYLREKEKTVLIATHDKEIVSLCTKKVEIKNDMAVYYDEII